MPHEKGDRVQPSRAWRSVTSRGWSWYWSGPQPERMESAPATASPSSYPTLPALRLKGFAERPDADFGGTVGYACPELIMF
jgi:hypothetical protein